MFHVAISPRLVLLTLLLSGISWEASAYGDALYSIPIEVDQVELGVFQIDVYEQTSTPGVENSIAIQGGFLASGNLALPPGYEYRWIQTVSSNLPAYEWQQPNVAYVDRMRTADDAGIPRFALNQSPFYGDVQGPDDKFTLPFGDNPARPAGEAFDGTWTLSLVAVQAPADPSLPFDPSIPGSGRNIFEITSFVWGYSVAVENGVETVTLKTPIQLPPDGRLAQAFQNDVTDGGDPTTFGGGAWNIQTGFPPSIAVPEPSSVLLLGLSTLAFGGASASAARRRKRAS
mgnify:CR=1 FL=1